MNPHEFNETRKIRQLLQSGLDDLPEAPAARLAHARRAALTRKKPEARRRNVLAFASSVLANGTGTWGMRARRAGTILPLLVGIGLFAGLFYAEDQQRIHDAADIDTAVLIDELPLSAYLDDGFRAFIENGGE